VEPSDNEPDHAGVKVPPPFIYLAGLLLGGLLEVLEPLDGLESPWRWIALALGIAGFVLLGPAAMRRFLRAETDLRPFRPTSAIVTDGPYRFTRNPMYVGMTLLYVGLAIGFDLIWALVLLPAVLLVIRFHVIAREERYLETKFGEEYLGYKRRVRRWV